MENKLFKRLLSLLVVVVMVMTMLPTVFADNGDCPEHKDQLITWEDVGGETGADWSAGIALSGQHHYILKGDVALGAAITVAADATICIDLNGHNITASASSKNSYRVFENNGTLIISDSEGTGIISGGHMETGDRYGGNIINYGVLKLHSGTISGGSVKGATSTKTYGGNIYSASGSELYILGGTVKDGTVKRNNYCSSTYYGGGNIYATGAKVVIAGGVISGGEASGANDTTTPSKRTTRHYGGNIAAINCSELTISNATITGGVVSSSCTASKANALAAALGGNIYASGTPVTITSATVTNGSASASATGCEMNTQDSSYGCAADSDACGGNIYITGSQAANISNSTVSGGQVTYSVARHANSTVTSETDDYDPSGNATGGNIYINSSATATLTNTTVSGGKSNYRGGNLNAGGTVYLNSGTEIIGGKLPLTSAAQWGGNIYLSGKLYMYDGSKVIDGVAYRGGNIHTATSDGQLYVYGGEISGGSAKDGTDNVKVYNHASCKVYVYGGKVESLDDAGDNNVIEIYNGQINWATANCSKAHVAEGNIWHSLGTCSECEHTYVEEFSTETPNSSTTHKTVLGLHTYVEGICSICDAKEPQVVTQNKVCKHCAPDGAEKTWTAWDGISPLVDGGHYYLANNVTLKLSAVEIAGISVCLDLNGCTLTTADGCRAFTISDGASLRILDNSTSNTGIVKGSGTAVDAHGGLVNVGGSKSSFYLYDATLKDGWVYTDHRGGAIYVSGGAAVVIDNGKVLDSKISGAGAGGENQYARGGNVSVYDAASSLTIKGEKAKISGGRCETESTNCYGGNLYLGSEATATIENGTISNGYTLRGWSADIMIMKGTVNMTGGIVGTADSHNASVVAQDTSDNTGNLYVSGGTLCKFSENDKPVGLNVVEIGDDVTTYVDPTDYLKDCVALNDVSAGKYVTCSDFATAYDAAEDGDTITLGNDVVDAGDVSLNGITLNLNGYSLTATSLDSSANGNVIDSTNGKGKVDCDDVMFHGDNTMVPVTTVDGTVFEKADITEKWHPDYRYEEGVSSTAKYVFYINPLRAATAMDDAMGDKSLLLSVHVKWTYDGQDKEEYFDLDPAMMAEFVEKWDTSALVLTLNNLENVTNLSVDAVIISNDVTAGANQ